MKTHPNPEVGDAMPAFSAPPVSRLTLALYAGASGDHNPIHVDIDYARANGVGDVFAHGMLAMAYMGCAVTGWVPQDAVRSLSARFVSPVTVGEQLSVQGRVVDQREMDGERQARIELCATNQHAELRVTGEAWIALP